MARFVIGISGASGVILGYKCCYALVEQGHFVHLVLSSDSHLTAKEEIEGESLQKFTSFQKNEKLIIHSARDFTAPIASGTFDIQAMAIVPCSMATLAAVSIGLGDTLLRRAADVTLKEGRKLVLVPRELPLSAIHLENMLKLAKLGVSIIPPQPAWYTHPKTIEDVEDFIVGRVLEHLGVKTNYRRWGS